MAPQITRFLWLFIVTDTLDHILITLGMNIWIYDC